MKDFSWLQKTRHIFGFYPDLKIQIQKLFFLLKPSLNEGGDSILLEYELLLEYLRKCLLSVEKFPRNQKSEKEVQTIWVNSSVDLWKIEKVCPRLEYLIDLILKS